MRSMRICTLPTYVSQCAERSICRHFFILISRRYRHTDLFEPDISRKCVCIHSLVEVGGRNVGTVSPVLILIYRIQSLCSFVPRCSKISHKNRISYTPSLCFFSNHFDYWIKYCYINYTHDCFCFCLRCCCCCCCYYILHLSRWTMHYDTSVLAQRIVRRIQLKKKISYYTPTNPVTIRIQ